MSRKITIGFVTAAAIALIVGAPSFVHAQSAEDQPQGHEHMRGQMQSGDAESSLCCQQMAKKKKEMHAKQEEIQEELDLLVEVMQSTTGDAQQEAIAALMSKIVEQHGQMSGMAEMHTEMMNNMKSGDMTDCPMMQKKDAKEGAEAPSAEDEDHSQHH